MAKTVQLPRGANPPIGQTSRGTPNPNKQKENSSTVESVNNDVTARASDTSNTSIEIPEKMKAARQLNFATEITQTQETPQEPSSESLAPVLPMGAQ